MFIQARAPKYKPRKKRNAKPVVSVNYDHITLTGKPVKIERSTKVETYRPPANFRRDVPNIPSLNSNVGNTNRKDPRVYTGTLIKGIATMHKSNAVPVINEEEMISISRMRRG